MNTDQPRKEPRSEEPLSASAGTDPQADVTKPRGTFAGTIDSVVRTRDGEMVAADTGDQGGGQN
ncbi:MAG: hypothetical protein JO271_16980 [Verrucomicrobia bacterium]|nr:hypothetical protein [Verrucomicrobiota bacterium]MBV9274926.1 hypothetical protein [Verrucomicrobiota bacterium]